GFEISEKVDELFAFRDSPDALDDHVFGEGHSDVELRGSRVGFEVIGAVGPGQSGENDLLHLAARLAVDDRAGHEASLDENLVDALARLLLNVERLDELFFGNVTPPHEGRPDTVVLARRARGAQFPVLEKKLADLFFAEDRERPG